MFLLPWKYWPNLGCKYASFLNVVYPSVALLIVAVVNLQTRVLLLAELSLLGRAKYRDLV